MNTAIITVTIMTAIYCANICTSNEQLQTVQDGNVVTVTAKP